MTILIKNADSPKCCKECKFKYAIGCRTYTGFHHQDTERAAKCPLIKVEDVRESLQEVPAADSDKYEYHYDHTDCIWYRPEARNRCPSTCAQYRDGWNDAMNYIFRDGKGYRPYRRDMRYEDVDTD